MLYLLKKNSLFAFCRHIEEDSGVLTAEALANMTPEELEFHYFSAHDFDKNSMLDGLELLKVNLLDESLPKNWLRVKIHNNLNRQW